MYSSAFRSAFLIENGLRVLTPARHSERLRPFAPLTRPDPVVKTFAKMTASEMVIDESVYVRKHGGYEFDSLVPLAAYKLALARILSSDVRAGGFTWCVFFLKL